MKLDIILRFLHIVLCVLGAGSSFLGNYDTAAFILATAILVRMEVRE